MTNELKLYNPNDAASNAIMTFNVESQEDKIRLYNLTTSPDKSLGDLVGEKIKIKDVYIEVVTLTNKDENGNAIGEPTQAPRTIIIDDKGVSYACVSSGVYNSLCRIFNILGMPNTWAEPLEVKVKQVNKGKNRILTLAI